MTRKSHIQKAKRVSMNTIEINFEIISSLQSMINDLTVQLQRVNQVPANNIVPTAKEYLTIKDVEELYGIKKSMQAKLRMNKINGIPYVRPAGSKIVLYPARNLNQWLEEWRAS